MASDRKLPEWLGALATVVALLAAGFASYVSMWGAQAAEEKVAPVRDRVTAVEKQQAVTEAVLPRVEKALEEIKADQKAQREATEAMLRELARQRRNGHGSSGG